MVLKFFLVSLPLESKCMKLKHIPCNQNVNRNITTPSSENHSSCFLSITALAPLFIQQIFTKHLLGAKYSFVCWGWYSEKTLPSKDTCIPLFIEALFTIARTWKQPRCPLTDDWIKKLWYIYTMEYYSAIKSNTFESVLVRWMNLEPIIQTKVSQK